MNHVKIKVLLLCAGSGTRAQLPIAKQYLEVHGRPLFDFSLKKFLHLNLDVYVVVQKNDVHMQHYTHVFKQHDVKILPTGGVTRAHSVYQSLAALGFDSGADYKAQEHILIGSGDAVGATSTVYKRYISEEATTHIFNGDEYILVHDAARPYTHISDLQALLAYAPTQKYGAILAQKLSDTIKYAPHGTIEKTLPREHLFAAQTPQMVPAQHLHAALAQNMEASDEAQALEKYGMPPAILCAQYPNHKVTYAHDVWPDFLESTHV